MYVTDETDKVGDALRFLFINYDYVKLLKFNRVSGLYCHFINRVCVS